MSLAADHHLRMDQVDDIIDAVKADELREQAQERDHERHLEQLRSE